MTYQLINYTFMRFIVTFFFALGFFHAFGQRNCATMEDHAMQLQQNPALQQQLQQIEQHNQHYHEQLPNMVGFRDVVTIPVVFHIIHNGDPVGSGENLAESYILAQLAQLNDDLRKLNTDQNLIPGVFQNLHADTEIQFCLAQRRPDGTATTGINRVQYAQSSWTMSQVNSTVKPATIWDRNQYLNVWTVVFGGSSSGILGYAQFPGGNASTDGVVVASNTVGSLSLPNPGSTNYGKGRTLTHEVGHWLNLRHIWGDATCGNDFVDDTPVHNTSNGGCPVYPHLSTCTGNPVEMTMNYMDYTNDACMQMFTFGQKNRMQAVLAPGGARFSLLSSLGCVPPSTSCNAPTVAQINASNVTTSSAQLNCTVSGVNAYDWRYRVLGATTWINLPSTSANLTTLSGLTASTSYEFQSSVQCGTTWSSWSVSQTFTTLAPPCNAPTIAQISASNIGTTSARINCSVTGVNAYDWRYRVVGATAWTDLASTSNSFADLNGLIASTTYEFQSSVRCGAVWSSWSASRTFTTLDLPCNAPTIAQISASNVGTVSARLNCFVSGVNAYDWRYRVVGTSSWTDLAPTTNNFADLSNLTASTAYEFQSSVQCGTTWSSWSVSQIFTTLAITCDAPLLAQLSTSNLGNTSVRLNCAVSGVNAYDWRYRPAGATTWIDLPQTTTPFIDIAGLNPQTTYQYQVSVQCGSVWSNWSSTASFTTTSGGNCSAPFSWFINVSDITAHSARFNYSGPSFQGYQWRYKISGTTTWTTSTIQTSTVLDVTDLVAGSQYMVELSVQCSNGSWSPWSSNIRFNTLSLPCSPPADNEYSVSDVSLSSAQLNCAVSGVSGYDWRYRIVGSNFWIDLPEGSANFFILSLLAPGTTYEFQVAVLCAAGWSGWSNSITFSTLSPLCDPPAVSDLFATQITDTDARLNCSVNGVNTYFWRYRAVGASAWINGGSTASNYLDISNLNPSTLYEFQVKVQCAGNTTDWSGSKTFTTLDPCLAPALSTLSATAITQYAAQLNCSALSSGSYFWRFRQVGASSWTNLGATATGVFYLTGLLSSTAYEFQVATQCGPGGGPWSVSATFATAVSNCSQPSGQSFNAVNIAAFSARFESYLGGVTQYDWRYRPVGSVDWVDLPESDVSGMDVLGLEPQTTYEFQSAVLCSNAWSPWSFSRTFTTLPNPCVAPTVAEIFISQVMPTSVRLNNIVSGSSAYHWRYKPMGTNTWIALPSTTTNYYDLENLNPGSGYEYQAAVSCGALTSAWSGGRRFLTPHITREETANPLQLKIWPVPARDEVFIRFNLPEGSSNAKLSLLDAAGRVVQSMNIGLPGAGVQTYALDLQNLPAGMYILKLHEGNNIGTEKLVIFAE